MAEHGKRYQDLAKLVDRTRVYPISEAIALAKETSTVKFDPTVEAHLRLGVDPRHADQMVRGTVVLPNGTGKVVRVAVENAVSVASILLLAEATLTEIPEPRSERPQVPME